MNGIRGIGFGLTLVCAAAKADAQGPIPARLEVQNVSPWEAGRTEAARWRTADGAAASAQALQPRPSNNLAFSDDGLRARVWWGRGAIEWGAGTDWRSPSIAGAPDQSWRHVVGVRAALSARTRLVYETDATLTGNGSERGNATPRSSRVALEFKSRKSPVSNLRDGLMRVQLSGDSAVHFKPRGGGLQVMYRERF